MKAIKEKLNKKFNRPEIEIISNMPKVECKEVYKLTILRKQYPDKWDDLVYIICAGLQEAYNIIDQIECNDSNIKGYFIEKTMVYELIKADMIESDCSKVGRETRLGNIHEIKKQAFLSGIEASKTIEWTNESEEIERVLKEWGIE